MVAGALLFGAGLTYELVARQVGSPTYRVAVGLACAGGLLLLWINLAVGFIGSENNPANLLFGGVLALGLLGALIARFRPNGMARALLAMALAQALVPVIALLVWKSQVHLGVVEVLADVFFVALWMGSALLFRRAGATGSTSAPTA